MGGRRSSKMVVELWQSKKRVRKNLEQDEKCKRNKRGRGEIFKEEGHSEEEEEEYLLLLALLS